MRKTKSIAEIGVYPPPAGGISVHVERLCDTLEQKQIPFIIYDGNGENGEKKRAVVPIPEIEKWAWKYLWKKNEDIIHNHFLRWQIRFTLSLLKLKGKKIVHTVHSLRNDGTQLGLAQKVMVFLTGLLSDHFVAVSEEVKEKLLELRIPERKISVIPAFIPPTTDLESDIKKIPDYVLKTFTKYPQVIVANGGVGNLYNGEELYGLDLCIDMFTKLARENKKLAFVYCITHIGEQALLEQYTERIAAHGLEERFLLVQEKIPFYPLIQKATLFVRPTASDGDAISLREAIYLGTPAIASDVVKRPNGVITFVNRDADDFTKTCREVLYAPPTDLLQYRQEQERYVEQLLDILL
ncbi:glycosyltransferase family 4 protein [Aneurinibacillus thermoaerophilus]|uniref:glycosyltransferase family 4 protein n=1 Tax=Aneurinibacillus thermoaerophilus TaxID=143495 RepID=UPI002E1B9C6C|nr:glycosyltransferase family 4 protein [Aneurinibacillus thermoaerophilus]MED0737200.1 glycosyltransferase family 4 protein [Aneurinibacillus thermoaerophilus]MED0766311.1 glycosyltransferase family 4 protein [Aneurinibacillus thermoaerophilus]